MCCDIIKTMKKRLERQKDSESPFGFGVVVSQVERRKRWSEEAQSNNSWAFSKMYCSLAVLQKSFLSGKP
jgi:hypothetical protein